MGELSSNSFLKWGNHHEALISLLDNLQEREKFVDVTLAAEGQFINAHKLVLSASSKYFEVTQISNHMKVESYIIYTKI